MTPAARPEPPLLCPRFPSPPSLQPGLDDGEDLLDLFEAEGAVGVHGVEGVDGDGVLLQVVLGDALDEYALLVYDDEVALVDEEA